MTATQDHTEAGSGYGNVYLDSLIWGHSGWNLSTGPITYWLAGTADAAQNPHPTANSFSDWSTAETTAFTTALANYSAVCGLTFAAASSEASANLVEWQISSDGVNIPNWLGLHEVPDGSASHNNNANQIWGYFNYTASFSWDQIQVGGDGYNTLLHELGHAMGLAHPHDGGGQPDRTTFPGVADGDSTSTGDNGQNQGPFTIMSYNPDYDGTPQTTEAYGEAATLGAFDIAALQILYGVNNTTATGNDLYYLPSANAVGTYWSCIWDAGGTDTITHANSATAAVIDLRAAPLVGPNAGGYISQTVGIQGGFTIAHGVTIENAVGGGGNDTLIGNDADNVLTGGAGADSIDGGLGFNTISFQDSNAGVLVDLSTGTGHGGTAEGDHYAHIQAVVGGQYADTMVGGSGAESLDGGQGNDYIFASAGADTLVGGGGTGDYLNYATTTGQFGIAINLQTGLGTAGEAQGDVVSGFEIVGGTNYADTIIGSTAGGEDLIGRDGNDILIGGGGNGDTLDGGDGFDTATIVLGNGNNTIDFKQAQTNAGLTLSDGTRLISIEAINLTTGAGNDFLDVRGTHVYSAADPTDAVSTSFDGQGGDDTLAVDLGTSFGAHFTGGSGIDTLVMDWSQATHDIRLYDAGTANQAYKAYAYTVTIHHTNAPDEVHDYYYSVAFQSDVERFNLTGGSGGDSLLGGAYNDTLNGGAGIDTVRGGAGTDLLVADYSSDTYAATLTRNADSDGGYYGNLSNNVSHSQVEYHSIEVFNLKTGSASDYIDAGDGNDTISTGLGDDTVYGGAGVDTIDLGGGIDFYKDDFSTQTANITVNLTPASSSVTFGTGGTVKGAEWVNIKLGSGADVVTTRTDFLNDYVDLGGGDDKITVQGGIDTVYGGTGNDTLTADYSTDTYAAYLSLNDDSIGGYSGNLYNNVSHSQVEYHSIEVFNVKTGSGDDLLTFGAGNDTVSTGLGNDTVYGGAGVDTVDLGGGIDFYKDDFSAQTASITVNLTPASSSVTFGTGGTVKGAEWVNIKLGSGADVVTTRTDFLNDYVDLGGGDDKITVQGGIDTVYGGTGNDTLTADYSTDTYAAYLTLNDDTVGGYSGQIYNNVSHSQVEYHSIEVFNVKTGSGDDLLTFGAGNDTVSTGLGNDTVYGGAGVDTVDLGGGVDFYQDDFSAQTANITVNLTPASSSVTFGTGGTVKGAEWVHLTLGSGNDVVTTRTDFLNDYVDLGGGNDQITVQGGLDTVYGGAGNDTLTADYSTDSYAAYLAPTVDSNGGYSGNLYNNVSHSQVEYHSIEVFNIKTGSGDDNLVAGAGNDTISTGAGADSVDGGAGVDIVDLGSGIDFYKDDVSSQTANITIDLTPTTSSFTLGTGGTVTGAEWVNLKLGSGNDVVVTRTDLLNDYVDLGAGNDQITVQGGNDTVYGGAGNDTLTADYSSDTYAAYLSPTVDSNGGYSGNLYNNVGHSQVEYHSIEVFNIKTGSGDDNLVAGAGNDTISTGAGADSVDGGAGVDIVDLGSGIDFYQDDVSSQTVAITVDMTSAATVTLGTGGTVTGLEWAHLTLGSGDDRVVTRTESLNDYFDLGAGNDTISTYAGHDTVYGGAGTDTLIVDYSSATSAEYLNAASDTLGGYSASIYDNVGGSSTEFHNIENFNVTTGSGNDSLQTGNGDDTLNGGVGDDTMIGGLGNDTYVVDSVHDVFTENANQGIDTIVTSMSFTLGDNFENLTLTGSDALTGTGNNLSNFITGNDGANTLSGGIGNDTLDGGLGGDSMVGGVGNDTYYVNDAGDRVTEALGQGTDSVHATVASYTLGANVERLYFDTDDAHVGRGNELSNIIYGNGGDDKFLIDAGGNDIFSGGGGEDAFDARTSTVGMSLRLDDQSLNGGSVAGDTFASMERFFGSNTAGDAMTTGAARAKFFGYGGDDTLTGGASIDALSGGTGNDSLVGNGGQDALDGGTGNDTMTGGAGNDTFTFADAKFGQDRILDFEDGGDVLKVFSAVATHFSDFTVSGNGTADVLLTLNADPTNTIALHGANGSLINLTASDFLFY